MSRPVVVVGDIHLGRRPSGLDEVLGLLGIQPRDLSAAAAWESAVEWAIQRNARAVVLAGDVVESARDRFEAFAHLHRGAAALAGAHIPVYAVAGNHDVTALPLLAERIPKVCLVGAGGRWELVPLPGGEGEPPVDLLGWSFPSEIVREDPTRDPGFRAALGGRRPGTLLVGVVHGDLDAPGSPYAPLSRSALEAAPADAWLLGHIHRPDPLGGERPLGYLGSLSALDPGETGPRGLWELLPDRGIRLHHVPLSPVRFENLALRVDHLEAGTPDALLAALEAEIRERLAPELEASRELRLLVVRLRLEGRTAARKAVREVAELDPRERVFPGGAVPLFLARVEDRTRPPVDLEELAASSSPAGTLARILLSLDDGIPPEMEEKALRALAPWRDTRWVQAGIPDPPPLDDLLRAAAWKALEELLDQRTGEPSP